MRNSAKSARVKSKQNPWIYVGLIKPYSANLLLTISGTGTSFEVSKHLSEGTFFLVDIDSIIPYKMFNQTWWDNKPYTASLNSFLVREVCKIVATTPWLLFVGALPFEAINQTPVLGWVNVGAEVIDRNRASKSADSGQPTTPIDADDLAEKAAIAAPTGKPEFKSIEEGMDYWFNIRAGNDALPSLDSLSRKRVSNKIRKLRRALAARARDHWNPDWAGWSPAFADQNVFEETVSTRIAKKLSESKWHDIKLKEMLVNNIKGHEGEGARRLTFALGPRPDCWAVIKLFAGSMKWTFKAWFGAYGSVKQDWNTQESYGQSILDERAFDNLWLSVDAALTSFFSRKWASYKYDRTVANATGSEVKSIYTDPSSQAFMTVKLKADDGQNEDHTIKLWSGDLNENLPYWKARFPYPATAEQTTQAEASIQAFDTEQVRDASVDDQEFLTERKTSVGPKDEEHEQ